MKMVAIDMDGTLLHSDRHITTYTTEIITALKKEHRFVVATGRSLTDAMQIVTDANIPADGYVCANGAVIADHNGNILKEEKLDVNKAIDVASWLNEHHYYYHLGTSDGHYATKNAYQFFLNDLEEFAEKHNDPEKMKQGIRTQADRQIQMMGLKTLDSPEEIKDHDFTPYKFLVLSLFPERLETIRKAWESDERLLFTSSGTDNVEIMPPQAEKGTGISFMAEHLQVAMHDTVAIGDNYNDLSMFRTAGLSISMGNADNYIKSQTDVVTIHHDDDGVAEAIKEHILK